MPLGGSPFSLQLFHLGSYHRYPVRIFWSRRATRAQILYDPALFDFGPIKVPEPAARRTPGLPAFASTTCSRTAARRRSC